MKLSLNTKKTKLKLKQEKRIKKTLPENEITVGKQKWDCAICKQT